MSKICDATFPIEEQEYPAFPVWLETTRKTIGASKALTATHGEGMEKPIYPWKKPSGQSV
jgi:hypothetical protein